MGFKPLSGRPIRLMVRRDGAVLYSLDFSKQTIMLGRSRGADLPINDDEASRQHALLSIERDGTIALNDSGSTNGTFLNGKAVTTATVQHGDTIRIGQTEIVVEILPDDRSKDPFSQPTSGGQKRRVDDRGSLSSKEFPERALEEGSAADLSNDATVLELSMDAPDSLSGKQTELESEPTRKDPEELQRQVEVEIKKNIRKPDYKPNNLEIPQEVIPFRAPTVLMMRDRELISRAEASAAGVVPRKKVLQVSLSWHREIVKVCHYTPGSKVYVGENLNNDFVLPSDKLPGSFLFLDVRSKHAFINLTEDMVGEIEEGGRMKSLEEVRKTAVELKRGLYRYFRVRLEPGTRVRVSIGLTALFIQFVPKVKPVPFQFWKLDTEAVKIYMITLLLFLIGVSLINLIPVKTYEERLREAHSDRIIKITLIEPQRIFNKPKISDALPLDVAAPTPETAQGAASAGDPGKKPGGQRAAGPEGARAARSKASVKTPRRTIEGEVVVPTNEILQALRVGSKGLAKSGQNVTALAQGLKAESDSPGVSGTSRLMRGKGLTGLGTGGGGLPGSVGKEGNLNIPGEGGGAKGRVLDSVGGRTGVVIPPIQEEVEIVGQLDREEVRRVVEENIGRVRNCYERQLNRYPRLQGKLVMRWAIVIGGSVADVSVQSSSLDSPDVSSCVAQAISSWRFPSPRGGGKVIVNYPFIFSPAVR